MGPSWAEKSTSARSRAPGSPCDCTLGTPASPGSRQPRFRRPWRTRDPEKPMSPLPRGARAWPGVERPGIRIRAALFDRIDHGLPTTPSMVDGGRRNGSRNGLTGRQAFYVTSSGKRRVAACQRCGFLEASIPAIPRNINPFLSPSFCPTCGFWPVVGRPAGADGALHAFIALWAKGGQARQH